MEFLLFSRHSNHPINSFANLTFYGAPVFGAKNIVHPGVQGQMLHLVQRNFPASLSLLSLRGQWCWFFNKLEKVCSGSNSHWSWFFSWAAMYLVKHLKLKWIVRLQSLLSFTLTKKDYIYGSAKGCIFVLATYLAPFYVLDFFIFYFFILPLLPLIC